MRHTLGKADQFAVFALNDKAEPVGAIALESLAPLPFPDFVCRSPSAMSFDKGRDMQERARP